MSGASLLAVVVCRVLYRYITTKTEICNNVSGVCDMTFFLPKNINY